jgi:hypothetical protein
MVDQEREITWATFCKHVHWSEVKNLFPDYSYHKERWDEYGALILDFHIKDDWAVQFCKSKYSGKPCYFIRHSGIEYIFMEE